MKRPRSFWSYQAATPTPSVQEAIRAGAFRGTEQQWEQLSPGMRREIVRSALKRRPTPATRDLFQIKC